MKRRQLSMFGYSIDDTAAHQINVMNDCLYLIRDLFIDKLATKTFNTSNQIS